MQISKSVVSAVSLSMFTLTMVFGAPAKADEFDSRFRAAEAKKMADGLEWSKARLAFLQSKTRAHLTRMTAAQGGVATLSRSSIKELRGGDAFAVFLRFTTRNGLACESGPVVFWCNQQVGDCGAFRFGATCYDGKSNSWLLEASGKLTRRN